MNPNPVDIEKQFFNPSALLRLVLDLLDSGVMFLDTDLTILYMNEAKRIRHPHVKLGMKWRDALESYRERSPRVREAIETGEIQHEPNCIVLEQSGVRHLDVRVCPVKDDRGKIVGAIEIAVDVEELVQSHEQVERLNREYESVIYALSHDLRAPLVSIEGFLKKLYKGHVDLGDEVAMHCLKRIDVNVKTMDGLITVLLDTSRVTRGKLELQKVDISELVNTVIHQFQSKADEQGATLSCSGDFPTMPCDTIRVQQIFSNLVANSLAHCHSTSELKIEIGCKNRTFWVKDNGPGIEKSFQDIAFDAFVQGENNGGHHFGMGLNIVYKIVRKHGGRTWIDSSPSTGTCILFTLSIETE